MIDADLRGKLGVQASRAHDRAEDLLTSTVFGLLRYLPVAEGIVPALERARPVVLLEDRLRVEEGESEKHRWLDTSPVSQCRIAFWPSFGRFGQPDLLLTLLDQRDRPAHYVLVEAKLHSAKSGEAGDESGELTEDVADPDQLAKYWQGLQRERLDPTVPRTLIYLTAHSAAPTDELEASLRRLPTMRLGWLSWKDIWHVAAMVSRRPGAPLAAADLARLLAHRGFKSFDGFTQEPISVHGHRGFWKTARWFDRRPFTDADRSQSGFWRKA